MHVLRKRKLAEIAMRSLASTAQMVGPGGILNPIHIAHNKKERVIRPPFPSILISNKNKLSLIIIFFFYFSCLCFGTTVIKLSLPEMVDKAAVIVKGYCVSIEETEKTFLEVKFSVEEVIKGEKKLKGKTLVIKLPGGSLDGYKLYVPGVRRFKPGEEKILFLTSPDPKGRWSVLGLSEGEVPIFIDPTSGESFVKWEGKNKYLNDFIKEIKGCIPPGPGQ